MTGVGTRITVILLWLGIPAACSQGPGRQAVEPAQRAAAMAAEPNPDQARLWQEAANQGTAIGMDRVVPSNRPVTSRRLAVAAAARGQLAAQAPEIVIPPRVETQLRILTAPAVGYSGAATVATVSGDRLELDLAKVGRLVVLARVAKAPIPVKGQEVRVVYVPRGDPRRSDEVLVIRTADGKGIGRMIRRASGPIEKMTVPLFGVTAEQEPKSPRVIVSLGNEKPPSLATGGTARLGNVFVRVVASYARAGSAAEAAEGPPYLINLLVWSP